jgi:hypothetical protein
MTTSGTWYYPPCAGTGNLLLTNPPFIMGKPAASHLNDYLTHALHMDTNQPTPAEGLQVFTEEDFQRLSEKAGGSGQFEACNYAHAVRIAHRAYQMGADVELDACCQYLLDGHHRFSSSDTFWEDAKNLREDRRPKPPTLKEQALAAARIELNPHGKNGALIMRALEALPE